MFLSARPGSSRNWGSPSAAHRRMRLGHTFARGSTRIDPLAPEGVGTRADLRVEGNTRMVMVPGGTLVLARTELIDIQAVRRTGRVPRPGPRRSGHHQGDRGPHRLPGTGTPPHRPRPAALAGPRPHRSCGRSHHGAPPAHRRRGTPVGPHRDAMGRTPARRRGSGTRHPGGAHRRPGRGGAPVNPTLRSPGGAHEPGCAPLPGEVERVAATSHIRPPANHPERLRPRRWLRGRPGGRRGGWRARRG